MISKDEFEVNLVSFGFKPTNEYTDDGKQRLWEKQDGQKVQISVWDEYEPAYLDWLMKEWGVGYITAYRPPS